MKLFTVLSSLTLSFVFASANKTVVSSNNIVYPDYDIEILHIVSLHFRRDGNNGLTITLCEGSIIDNNWVVTTAQCLHYQDSVQIYYGSNWRPYDQFIHRVHSNNFIQHQLWPNTNGTDIGLIRTPYVYFNSRVNKVRLPSLNQRENELVKWLGMACGWGGRANDDLLCAEYKCSSTYRPIPYDVLMCRKTSDGENYCSGKSGGPLVRKTNPPILEGIILADFNNLCTTGTNARFTRVFSHLYWIRQHTGVAYY